MSDVLSYNVFISWSGPTSKAAAEALREWIPMVVQRARPWMSATDIEKGSNWQAELTNKLESIQLGIAVLTPGNLNAPWLLFESGAIASKPGDARLCNYLLSGLSNANVPQPLGIFQNVAANSEGTAGLVEMLNNRLSGPKVDSSVLKTLVESTWPLLEQRLAGLPREENERGARLDFTMMIAEILEWTREETRRRESQSGSLNELLTNSLWRNYLTNQSADRIMERLALTKQDLPFKWQDKDQDRG